MILAVVLALVAFAALFFVVAGVVITMSGVRARRGVKGDIALTGFFVVCFVLAAWGCALIALPNTTEQAERRPTDGGQETPRPDQPTTERTEGETTARSAPAATLDSSLDLDCEDFTSQEAAQKAFDQDLEDPNALDPDADGTACDALAAPDPEKEPASKKSEKKSASENKAKPDKKPTSEKKAKPEEES